MQLPGRHQVVFYFVAGALLSLAALGGYFEAHGLRHGVLTSGTVVQRNDGGKVPTITLRFVVPGRGEVVCITDTFRSNAEAGQKTRVRYDAEDPEQNCSTGERGGYGGFALGVVVALSLLGNGERLRRRRQRLLAPEHDQ
jgi:hypothetical protein